LKKNKFSCLNKLEFYLNSIKKNLHLNAFINIYSKDAIFKSKKIDKKIKKKKLSGIIVGLKDLICYKNYPIQASSKILKGFISKFNATLVNRIIQEDGIIIGHQNCDEFGMGSSNENSFFGPVLNPIDNNKVSGGSSGGSAVSVQKKMCCISIGSDTGGSIRQPASFCGVIGMKPTYSRISRYGLIAYASSFDTIGIISKNISECAKILEVVSGNDSLDNTSSFVKVDNYTEYINFTNKKYKIAYIKQAINHKHLNKDIKQKTLLKIDFLKNNGYQVDEIDYNLLNYMLPVYHILSSAEASSNLSRFDGIRYGYKNNSDALTSVYYKSRINGFNREVKRRILLGTFVLSSKYYNSYYLKAQKIRHLIKKTTRFIFNKYDFIISPTTPTTAFNIGENIKNPIAMYLSDLYTVQASLSGIPAISIPNGFDKKGMPVGLQIMSDVFEEKKLLSFANYLLKNN